ncbi:hypothetical protein HQ529_05545 [Candidatus Woesearchaeota archaeon]|nr:hypothetical protein [Candidatus Woesearchaeota archaeon]
MINMPFEDILKKIEETSNLSTEVINDKIKKKMDQLSGLISKEGAAHIIANELGVKLFDSVTGKIKINKALSGMRNIETVGKVQQVFDIREFTTANRQGKVGSFVMADDTGSIRIVLWNDQVSNIENLNADDVVKITNGYVRDNNGRKEIHLNDKSTFAINPSGEKVDNVISNAPKRKTIKNLVETDDNVEIVGTVVQLFDPRFFERKQGEGSVTSYVINTFVDDGTDNLRVVCFGNQVQKLLTKTHDEVMAYKDAPETFEEMKTELMGNIIKFKGRVTKNEMFDRLEFIANMVFTDINPDEEIKRLTENAEEVKEAPVEKQVAAEEKEDIINEAPAVIIEEKKETVVEPAVEEEQEKKIPSIDEI